MRDFVGGKRANKEILCCAQNDVGEIQGSFPPFRMTAVKYTPWGVRMAGWFAGEYERQMRGSLRCAAHDDTVSGSGRDDEL